MLISFDKLGAANVYVGAACGNRQGYGAKGTCLAACCQLYIGAADRCRANQLPQKVLTTSHSRTLYDCSLGATDMTGLAALQVARSWLTASYGSDQQTTTESLGFLAPPWEKHTACQAAAVGFIHKQYGCTD